MRTLNAVIGFNCFHAENIEPEEWLMFLRPVSICTSREDALYSWEPTVHALFEPFPLILVVELQLRYISIFS